MNVMKVLLHNYIYKKVINTFKSLKNYIANVGKTK